MVQTTSIILTYITIGKKNLFFTQKFITQLEPGNVDNRRWNAPLH